MSINRTVAWSLMIALIFTLCFGVLELPVQAADFESRGFSEAEIFDANGDTQTAIIRKGDRVTLEFDISFTDASNPLSFAAGNRFTCGDFAPGSGWKLAKTSTDGVATSVELELTSYGSATNTWTARVTVANIIYNSSDRTNSFALRSTGSGSGLLFQKNNTTDAANAFTLNSLSGAFNEGYFKSSGGGTSTPSDDDDEAPTPKLRVESVKAFDKDGKPLGKIDKDTAPFSVEIVYSDFGMIWEVENIEKDRTEAYFTPSASSGFRTTSTRGTISQIATLSANDAPRFRVTFTNLTYNGKGTALEFTVYYDWFGELLEAAGSAEVPQADLEDEEEDEIAAATPYIIVSQFAYGDAEIIAGNTFDLNITYKNTSSDLALENIVMTISTPEHLSIASASNTVYVDRLAAGGSLNHTIKLQARPSATAGAHSVEISFSYQYIAKKERKDGVTKESISIPVTQIDRFAVDPITEMSEYVTAGDSFYVTVGFINRGKSNTYNVSATARGVNKEIIAASQHYGNVAAGASDTVDIDMTCHEPGELMGEVVVTYEDDNMNQKEIVMPFTMYIEAPYVPEPPTDPGMLPTEPEPPKTNLLTLVLSIVGGLMVAASVALFVARRVKAKESGEFDEDF